jgi:hypothetical protein
LAFNTSSASILLVISAFRALLEEVSNSVIWSWSDFSAPLALVTSPSIALLFAVSAEVALFISAFKASELAFKIIASFRALCKSSSLLSLSAISFKVS